MTLVAIPTATRPILLERIEYGAQVVQTGTIYMHDDSLSVVEAFIGDFSIVTPIRLVTRTWVGDSHTAWKEETK